MFDSLVDDQVGMSGGAESIQDSMPSQDQVIDMMLSRTFGSNVNDTATPADTQQAPVTQQPAGEQAAQQPPANNAATAVQQQAAPNWSDVSQKAFLDDSGSINMDKVNTYILGGKSMFSFVPMQDASAQQQKNSVEQEITKTPEEQEAEYRENIRAVSVGWLDKLQDYTNQFGSVEKAIQVLRNENETWYNNHLQQREVEQHLAKVREEVKKELAPLEKVKQEAEDKKREAEISKNLSSLAVNFEGLIPGMDGNQVMDQLIYDPKYAGNAVKMMLADKHPNVFSMPDGEEKNKIVNQFNRELLADSQRLGFLAEYGKMKWIISDQLPQIIKQAVNNAIANQQASREAAGAGVSKITGGKYDSGIKSASPQIFGIDIM